MRKTTLPKILFHFWLCSMVGTITAFSQCPTITQPNQSFCDSESPTISSLQANANGSPTVSWFATATSTTPLNPSSGLVNGNTYYVSNTAGTCPRQSVTVTVYSPPTGPVVQGICADTPADATVSDLQATGNNVQWYDAPSGGNLLNPTDLLVNGTTYYATQTNPITGCQTSPLTVVASIFLTPVPTGSALQEFCNNPTNIPLVGDLQPSGSGYRWYATSSSSVPLNINTALIDGESYYAASVNGPCQSTQRLEVFVDLVATNDAGTDGTFNVCINELASESPLNLFSQLGGSPDTTGIWTGPFPTSNGNLGTVDLAGMTIAGSPYVFTYTVTSALCPPDTSTVSITVLPLPVVTIASNQIICAGQQATVTFTGTANSVVTYTVNGGSNQTITLNASGSASIINTYSATTTFTLVSVSSPGIDSCTAMVAGSIVITVIQLPTATIASNQTICQGQSATITFTGTPNATVVYNTGGANQSIVLNASGTASIISTFNATTTYTLISVTSAGTPACARSLTGSITITVIPTPVVSIASNVTVCMNGSATITFTGTPNAVVTYVVSGIGNQTITLNASGTATITQNYSATTVYTLVSITTGTSPSCIVPVTGNATVTVLPVPMAAIAANQTICIGQSATVTITGTPNATVTYTSNGGGTQTIILNASGIGTITGTYSVTTTIALVSITTAGTPACTQALTGSVVITIAPAPTATIASSQTICAGESATVTFTGTPGATVNYTSNGSGASVILNASGTATITQIYTATTTFVLVSVTSVGPPSCTQILSGQVVITVVPAPTVTIEANQTICSGQQATITFTGTPGAIVTYNIGGGPNLTITLNASGTASFTNTYTATTTINLVSVTAPGNVCVIPVTGSVVITVTPLPTASFSASQTICANESATINFTGTPNAVVTFTANPGGTQTITLDASGTASLTQTFTATTTFTLVSAAVSGCSQNLSGTVTITVLTPPVAYIAASQTVCPNTTVTLTITGTPNSAVSYAINPPGTPAIINLDSSGAALITVLVTQTTTVTLTQVSNSDCTVPLAESVILTVQPLPVVTISSDQTICTGDSATVNFTGSPGAIIGYTVNGTAFTITLDASGNAAVTGNYSVETLFQLVSATLSGTPACSQPVSGTVTISIAEPPFVTILVDTTICSGDTAIVAFNGTPGATVNYTVNGSPESLLLSATGTATLSNSYTVTTVIALISVTSAGTPGCTENVTGQVTITVIPPPVAAIASDTTICSGDSATITFTGTPGAIVTYTIGSGANQTITLNASGSTTITNTYTATTVFTLVSVSNPTAPVCPQPLGQTATITVVNLPTASMTISGASTICEGQSTTITFTGTPGATITYTLVPGTGGTVTLDASGTATISPVLTATTVITLVSASTTAGANCTQNIGTTLSVTVDPAPNAGNDVASFEICSDSTPQDLFLLLGPDAQTGGTWTPSLASGTGVFNPAIDAEGTYVYTVAGTSVCNPDTSSVTVTVIPDANAGNDSSVNVCSNEDPIDLFALLGTDAQTGGTWSPALASGTGVFNPAIDPAGNYTYTVTGTAPCPNDSAVVSITIIPGPDAGQDGSLTLCINSEPQDLINSLNGTPQVGGTWSPALASGTGVFNPAIDLAGVYTYTFIGNNPCDNDTATVTVTVNPIPNAGTNGSTLFCTNYDPADLITFLGGTPQPGGTWSPALASGTGVFNPQVDPAGVYTYTVGGGFCDTATATVTVTVVQAPIAGADGTINTCLTTTSLDLTTGLDGTQGAGSFEDTDASGALSGNIFNPSAVGIGTYHFTYTVGGGVSPCLFDTAVVTVIVEPQPNAGTFAGIQSVCVSENTFDLSILLTGNQAGGTWSTQDGTSVTNPIILNTYTQGTYTFNYTISNSCGSDTESVQVNINANPVFSNANLIVSSPVCAGSNVTVSLIGIADGSYAVSYDLTGANAFAGLSETITVTGGAGSFIIPASSVPNLGVTAIVFNSIVNTVSNCSTSLTNVLVNFTIVPLPDLTSSTITATSVCLGNAVVISLTGATGIANGTYIFGYTIPGANSAGTSGPIAVNAGAATFTIPASAFIAAGNYTITLNSVDNGSGCVNTSGSVNANFEIFAIPDLTNAILTAADVCLGFDGEIIISNATGLVEGTYTITYQLSGASAVSGNASVDFTGGDGSFVIPSAELPALGQVTITIQDIVSAGGSCGPGTTITLSGSFEVSQPETPVLVENGDEFCATDNPTIADLSANIQGNGTVIFYDALTGGIAYSTTDALVQGTTYYAALNNGSGCESPIRLAVTVDLTHCDELLIPDGFSPNGDGINDEFVIVNIGTLYPNFKLEIYNRYGNVLYKGNINTANWNGTTTQGGIKLGDGEVPVGVYFYILEFNDGTRKPQQGRLYLSR